jgi:hypothetical protein
MGTAGEIPNNMVTRTNHNKGTILKYSPDTSLMELIRRVINHNKEQIENDAVD